MALDMKSGKNSKLISLCLNLQFKRFHATLSDERLPDRFSLPLPNPGKKQARTPSSFRPPSSFFSGWGRGWGRNDFFEFGRNGSKGHFQVAFKRVLVSNFHKKIDLIYMKMNRTCFHMKTRFETEAKWNSEITCPGICVSCRLSLV